VELPPRIRAPPTLPSISSRRAVGLAGNAPHRRPLRLPAPRSSLLAPPRRSSRLLPWPRRPARQAWGRGGGPRGGRARSGVPARGGGGPRAASCAAEACRGAGASGASGGRAGSSPLPSPTPSARRPWPSSSSAAPLRAAMARRAGPATGGRPPSPSLRLLRPGPSSSASSPRPSLRAATALGGRRAPPLPAAPPPRRPSSPAPLSGPCGSAGELLSCPHCGRAGELGVAERPRRRWRPWASAGGKLGSNGRSGPHATSPVESGRGRASFGARESRRNDADRFRECRCSTFLR